MEQQVSHIGRIAVQALKEMRLLVYELRPPELEKEGLARALRRRVEAVEGRAGMEGRVVTDDLGQLPDDVEQNLYRIAQEALNNSLKHAAASSVVVYLSRQDPFITLEIVDDGLGFDPQRESGRGGMGLENIRERALHLGGIATIRSAPGEGTSVKVMVNLDKETEAAGGLSGGKRSNE